MMLRGGSSHRAGRAALAMLALVANLIAAGVPVLHAWAHDAHALAHEVEPAHGAAAVVPEADHPHEEVHPLALHEECLLVHRAALNLALALPAAPVQFESLHTDETPAFHPVSPVASRAPPSGDHARAPPLV